MRFREMNDRGRRAAASWTPAEAGFREDVFGGPNSDAPSATVRKTGSRASAWRDLDNGAQPTRHSGHADIRFMTQHTDDGNEERRSVVHQEFAARLQRPTHDDRHKLLEKWMANSLVMGSVTPSSTSLVRVIARNLICDEDETVVEFDASTGSVTRVLMETCVPAIRLYSILDRLVPRHENLQVILPDDLLAVRPIELPDKNARCLQSLSAMMLPSLEVPRQGPLRQKNRSDRKSCPK